MLWRTSPIGTELEEVVVGWLRQALGLPDGVRRAAHRHGLDVVAHRARGRPRGGRPGRGRARTCRSAGRRAASRLRLGRGAQLDREGVHDARARAGGARPRPDDERFELRARRARGGDRRRSGGRPTDRSRSSPRSGPRHRRRSIPVAAIADIAEREGLWLHVDAAYAGAVAIIPERRGAVRRLGARRLDRREPAQMAVHAARCLAAADPADGDLRTRSASSRNTSGRSTATRRSATTTSTRRSSGAGSGRSSCGSSCAGSGWKGSAGGSIAISSWPRRSPRWVDADPEWERLAPVPFSTVCFRWTRDAATTTRTRR